MHLPKVFPTLKPDDAQRVKDGLKKRVFYNVSHAVELAFDALWEKMENEGEAWWKG